MVPMPKATPNPIHISLSRSSDPAGSVNSRGKTTVGKVSRSWSTQGRRRIADRKRLAETKASRNPPHTRNGVNQTPTGTGEPPT